MVTDAKTFLDDPASLKALIDRMEEPDRTEYKGYGALTLEAVFPSRKMVVYTLKGGKPLDIVVITFGAFMSDWETGPNAKLTLASTDVRISTTPARVGNRDVFLHIPQQFVLKYKGRTNPEKGVDFVSHYAVLVKTRSKEIHQIESHTYCVTLNHFRERFPDLKLRY
jgi:hypothetical protein